MNAYRPTLHLSPRARVAALAGCAVVACVGFPASAGASHCTPPPAPPTAQFAFTPPSPKAGDTVTFDGSTSVGTVTYFGGLDDPFGGGGCMPALPMLSPVESYSWSFGDGGSGAPAGSPIATHAFASAGTYPVTLTVVSGGRSDSESRSITVSESAPAPAGDSGAPAGGSTGATPDTIKPALSAPTLTRRVFRAASRGPSAVAAAASGTRINYTLSEPATVHFAVQRWTRGRYAAQRGSFRHAGTAGANRLRFTGRLRGRKLKPGRYRLTQAAVDASGNRSATKRVGFRIAR